MPEIFLPKVVTVFPLKVPEKLNFRFLIVHRNHPFCDLNIPSFPVFFNPQYFTKLKRWSCAKYRNPSETIDIDKNEWYIKNVGQPFSGCFFILHIKKRPGRKHLYTNEMTLGLSHLSPTIKQGSFLFYFSI